MKRFIQMVISLFSSKPQPIRFSIADKFELDVPLKKGDARNKRAQLRQFCKQLGIDKPWSQTSLSQREWKEVAE
jgi:hypothetical protein